MARYIDLTGQVFNYWTVLQFSHVNERREVYWLCQCKCGTKRAVKTGSLRSKSEKSCSRSCGCFKKEKLRTDGGRNKKHGRHNHPIYYKWKQMRQRCMNVNADRYQDYGGRGIKICDAWSDFQIFYDDLISSWWEGASLDRIDVDGNYTPTNCRWVTKQEQAQNKRNTIYVDYKGERRRLKELCDKKLVPNEYETIKCRLKRGWADDAALWRSVEEDMSSAERKIKVWLVQQNIEYVYNKRFQGCKDKSYLPFDFFLPAKDTLIEFDGAHHFNAFKFGDRIETADEMLRKTQVHDKIKTEFAEENNYRLIRISNINQIDEILKAKVSV